MQVFLIVNATLGAAYAIAEDGDRIVGASLVEVRSGVHALDFIGSSVGSEGGIFRVTISLHRVPCPGLYRYVAYGEDLTNSRSTTFDSRVAVRRFGSVPPGLDCGGALPSRTGTAGAFVRLIGSEGPLLTFEASGREPDGSFESRLDLGTVPVCREQYPFVARFFNPRSSRVYRYGFEVLSARATVNGVNQTVRGCDQG